MGERSEILGSVIPERLFKTFLINDRLATARLAGILATLRLVDSLATLRLAGGLTIGAWALPRTTISDHGSHATLGNQTKHMHA